MILHKLVLATAVGTAVFAFVGVACNSSSSPNTGQPVTDGGAPVADSASPGADVAEAVDSTPPVASASPPVDSSTGSDGSQSDDDAAAVCVGCASRLSVNGPTAPTCTTNGPPSSHTLLTDWGECLCSSASMCAPTCEVCSNGQAMVTQACLNCGQQACPTQYAACAADTTGFVDDAGSVDAAGD